MKRHLSTVLLVLTLSAGCIHSAPTAPAVPASVNTTIQSNRAGRIIIGIDVDDRTVLCVERTMPMIAENPVAPPVICLESIGELRRQFSYIQRAN
tara:strand:+ start:612 stop:896 length:285 start_codon:yes stop_codon:yes gene_type:complete